MTLQHNFGHFLPFLLEDPNEITAVTPAPGIPVPPLTELTFLTGRRGGRQCFYNEYVYSRLTSPAPQAGSTLHSAKEGS